MDMRMRRLQKSKVDFNNCHSKTESHSYTVPLVPSHMMDHNTAAKIRGCFIGIPGGREPRPAEKGDMHLVHVSADLHFISSEWWSSRSVSRPDIANSDRSVWGMHEVRIDLLDLASSTDSQRNSCFRLAKSAGASNAS